MAHDTSLRNFAHEIRREGHSIGEIAKRLKISMSTASRWCSSVVVSQAGATRLESRKRVGAERGRQKVLQSRSSALMAGSMESTSQVAALLLQNKDDQNFWQVQAALLYWCEGGKRGKSAVCFANSDP